MPNYSGAQLRGAGQPIPALTKNTQYTFVMVVPTHLSGSGYFTVETVKNNTGSYAGQERNASGSYANLVNIPSGSLIKDDYKSSIVVHKTSPVAVSYKFTPAVNVAVSSSMLRSTGNIGVQIS